MLLAFERIDVECPESVDQVLSLPNDPTEPRWTEFREFLDALDFHGRWEVDDHLVTPIGPQLSEDEVKSLGTLLAVAKGDLLLRNVEDKVWQLERPSAGLRLAVDQVNPCGNDAGSTYTLYESKSRFRQASEVAPDEPKARVVLRSPQSVLFYLGEQSREGREVLLRRRPHRSDSERRLFTIAESDQCVRAHVKVQYDGIGQVIPRGDGECHPGRSMQALALAAQLLSLQQSSRDLPAAGTVRLIGQ